MTLEQHAAAISAAIKAAHDDGFLLEDDNCEPPRLDLRRYDCARSWRLIEWAEIPVPD